jgi:[methyl-Co(III) methanol-specific corrinoid protein]:coenzyme M methyltransferase
MIMKNFQCPNRREPPAVETAVLARLGVTAPEQLHVKPQRLAQAVQESRNAMGSRLWRLPLCHTLEAECLGASPVLMLNSAMVKGPAYDDAGGLPREIQLHGPRAEAMWQALQLLRQSKGTGHRIVYDLEGPFTVLSMLLPLEETYGAALDGEQDALLRRLLDQLLAYAHMAWQSGADILSVADPVVTIDLVGERLFRACYQDWLLRYLSGLRTACPGALIHLCGRLSQSLLDTGACRAEFAPAPEGMTYEQLLLDELARGEPYEMVGNACLNHAHSTCDGLVRILRSGG